MHSEALKQKHIFIEKIQFRIKLLILKMSVSFLTSNMSRQFLSNVLLPPSSVVNQMFANVAFFGSAATPGKFSSLKPDPILSLILK